MVPEGQMCQSRRRKKKDVKGQGQRAGIDAASKCWGKEHLKAPSYVSFDLLFRSKSVDGQTHQVEKEYMTVIGDYLYSTLL